MLHRVRSLALWSRLGVFLLQVVANAVIPDYHPDVFNPPSTTAALSFGDKLVRFMLGGFRRWDAIYFLFIAEHGYVYENCLAFFPLYPQAVRMASGIVGLFLRLCDFSTESLLLLCGSALNVVCFVKAAQALYGWISVVDHGKYRTNAFPTVLAFCFNPASIFFSACYSESLFCCLSFTAFLHLERSYQSTPQKKNAFAREMYLTAFLAMLSGAARSNGVVIFGVFILKKAQTQFQRISPGKQLLSSSFDLLFISVIYGMMAFVPFVLFQMYSFRLHCSVEKQPLAPALIDYAVERGYIYLDPSRNSSSWCDSSLPVAYSHVQKSHWNVGMLSYYELKQLPNFLLALPVLVLSCWTLWTFLPFRGPRRSSIQSIVMQAAESPLLPYVAHLGFLVAFCLFFVHIQISTRLLCSSSPLLYLAVGLLMPPTSKNIDWSTYIRNLRVASEKDVRLKLCIQYFAFYAVIGTILHANFFPWT
ncbi:hypothetical protein RvY_01246 [Ramazzottius varieornatus]|uniref:GPI mannosyltransferase 2 n=1 Tax=Ramazzottius varieornatus TaxID=947166 RepID=A0A1D1UJK4_RAMVA|nr:hypothetical protein RvY_01246 [Ramazzottius varieornatus]